MFSFQMRCFEIDLWIELGSSEIELILASQRVSFSPFGDSATVANLVRLTDLEI